MLTVLHRGPDGSERIFEAESVTRFTRDGEEAVPALGTIHASGITGVENGFAALSIEKPFGAVFVMNRFGQTVARYTA